MEEESIADSNGIIAAGDWIQIEMCNYLIHNKLW